MPVRYSDLNRYVTQEMKERDIHNEEMRVELLEHWGAMLEDHCGFMSEWAGELVDNWEES